MIYRYIFDKAQRGWYCRAEYTFAHSSQFTDISAESLNYGSRWMWLAFLRCWFGARRERKIVNAIHKPQRLANGWN